jgi:hypothetical protein
LYSFSDQKFRKLLFFSVTLCEEWEINFSRKFNSFSQKRNALFSVYFPFFYLRRKGDRNNTFKAKKQIQTDLSTRHVDIKKFAFLVNFLKFSKLWATQEQNSQQMSFWKSFSLTSSSFFFQSLYERISLVLKVLFPSSDLILFLCFWKFFFFIIFLIFLDQIESISDLLSGITYQ